MSDKDLAVAGLTGAKQLVMIALLAPGSQLLDDLPYGTIERVLGLVPTGAGLALLAVVAVLAWFALAVLAQLVADLDFTLTSDGPSCECAVVSRRSARPRWP